MKRSPIFLEDSKIFPETPLGIAKIKKCYKLLIMLYSLIISLSRSHEAVFPINTTLTIGRGSELLLQGNRLYLPAHRFISRHHCSLIVMPPDETSDRPYYKIKDGDLLGNLSTNRTWINGRAIACATKLNHRDVITFASGSEYPRVTFVDNYATIDEKPRDEDTAQHEYSQAITE